MKTFALAGNPNSGKTTLFNTLTGSTAHVGNWAGVTVDKKVGTYKKLDEPISIVDLPGIYSLSPYTSEEVVARNFLLCESGSEKPDCIINIVDATNLERNLYLTTQLLEIEVPVVIALNMMDAVEKSGKIIDIKKLSEKIGVPVVAISALKKQGTEELMEVALIASKTPREGKTVLENSDLIHLISDVEIALTGQKVDNSLFHAIKLVELDEVEVAMHPNSVTMVEKFKQTYKQSSIFGTDFEAMVADARYKHITRNYMTAVSFTDEYYKTENFGKADKADRVLTHKIFGIPIFLLILFVMFHFVFSENFLFLGGALGDDFISLEGTAFEGVFGVGGINSPGVILQRLMETLTNWVQVGVEGWLINAPEWVSGLICDGILGGLSAVLSFIPQILLLLLFFSILEDSGYMARVAFILDRIFKKFGLSGRAFIPMIMGFGCSVPAMINTRTLTNEKERIATLRVIPFFSCGAKLPILTAISGGIVMQFGVANVDLITMSMYLLGIVVALVSLVVMHKTINKNEVSPFIMELPDYRLPQFSSLMLHLWDKAKHFIKKAFTVILASTVVVWFVSHFSFSWNYLGDEQINQSILAGFGQLLQPLLTPLGFGSQLSEWGWVFVVSTIAGLIAKENVIAIFGTLAASIVSGFEGASEVASVVVLIEATGITVPALISFIAFNMLTIPCFAATATAKAELNNKKTFRLTLLFWVAVSYFVGTMIYLIGSWWWTSFIFAGVFAILIIILHFHNKKTS